MRFFVSGPRIFGVRPGVVFDPIQRSPTQNEPSGSFVYVIHGAHNLVKIGITTNPAARIAQIRTGSGFPIDFSYIGYVQAGAEIIEREAHAALARQRCAGEWFDTSPERAIAAVTRAAGGIGAEIAQCDLANARNGKLALPAEEWKPTTFRGKHPLIVLVAFLALWWFLTDRALKFLWL